MTEGSSGSALLSSPSGSNGCEFTAYGAFCTTTAKTAPPPDPSVTPGFLSVNLKPASPKIQGYGTDAPEWTRDGLTVGYGRSAYWKNYACGSTTAGLTCWNTITHHGALINTSGITTF